MPRHHLILFDRLPRVRAFQLRRLVQKFLCQKAAVTPDGGNCPAAQNEGKVLCTSLSPTRLNTDNSHQQSCFGKPQQAQKMTSLRE